MRNLLEQTFPLHFPAGNRYLVEKILKLYQIVSQCYKFILLCLKFFKVKMFIPIFIQHFEDGINVFHRGIISNLFEENNNFFQRKNIIIIKIYLLKKQVQILKKRESNSLKFLSNSSQILSNQNTSRGRLG